MGSKTQNKLAVFIACLTILICIVIGYDFVPFLRGPAPYPPDWQWEYLFVNTVHKLWVPAFFIAAILFFAFFLEKRSESVIKRHEIKILLACMLLFFILQLAISYFSRAGIGVLVNRIINPDMNGYFTAANSIENIPLFLATFNEQVLSLPQHAQGHPPGAILFFWAIEHLLRPFTSLFSFLESLPVSHDDVLLTWQGLSLSEKMTALFTAVGIPFLAGFSPVLVYYIGKYLYSVRVGIRSAFLLMTIPSMLLFIPINDVFLPLFPLASFLWFIQGMREEKKYKLLLSGFIFSVGLFFSLSIVPLLFIFAVYLCLIKNIQSIVSNGLVFSSGLILLPLVLFLFFTYNTIIVSQTLLSGLPEYRQYWTWVVFNLIDFFIFLGIPLCIFFCMVLFHLGKNVLKAKIKREDLLSIGFICMLFLLNISGAVRGEVARIWIPFYPFLALILAWFLTKEIKIKSSIFLLILFLQFVQVLVMQEFWVMLW